MDKLRKNMERHEKNKNGRGEHSGTYLRQTIVSSGPWVSVANTHTDETKQKW